MNHQGSVTIWLAELKVGNEVAAEKIWERYFAKLVNLARLKIGGTSRSEGDEEDVVATAMHNLWNGVQNGKFPRLNDRNDLWQILLMLTDRRATDLVRKSMQRGRHEISVEQLGSHENSGSIQQHEIACLEPSPEFAAQLIDDLNFTLEKLQDATLRQVALWKLAGDTNFDIAEKLGCVERTVERKLRLIRERIGEI